MNALSAARAAAQVEGISRLARLMREISASAAARASQPQRAPAAAALPGFGLLPEQARACCSNTGSQLIRAHASADQLVISNLLCALLPYLPEAVLLAQVSTCMLEKSKVSNRHLLVPVAGCLHQLQRGTRMSLNCTQHLAILLSP